VKTKDSDTSFGVGVDQGRWRSVLALGQGKEVSQSVREEHDRMTIHEMATTYRDRTKIP
jgi:hypothetical protein